MAELLRLLPTSHPQQAPILQGYRRMMDALLACKASRAVAPIAGPTHLLGRDLGLGDVLLCLRRRRAAGLVAGRALRARCAQGLAGVDRAADRHGRSAWICVGTGAANDEQHYLNRPRAVGDLHGQAPMLWPPAPCWGDEGVKRRGLVAGLMCGGVAAAHAAQPFVNAEVVLLQPESVLAQRIGDTQRFAAYMQQVEAAAGQAVEGLFQRTPAGGFLVLALRPGGSSGSLSRVWLDLDTPLPEPTQAAIRSRIEAVPAPEVSGLVVVSLKASLGRPAHAAPRACPKGLEGSRRQSGRADAAGGLGRGRVGRRAMTSAPLTRADVEAQMQIERRGLSATGELTLAVPGWGTAFGC